MSAIRLLIDTKPGSSKIYQDGSGALDSKSDVAPFRFVNIGNSKPERLLDFIEAIEKVVGIRSFQKFYGDAAGDVPMTWADSSLLTNLTGLKPQTPIDEGVKKFVDWYREYYL